MKILIQIRLDLPEYKNSYFKKENNKTSKITKKEFFKLYDLSWSQDNIEILPSVTYELK